MIHAEELTVGLLIQLQNTSLHGSANAEGVDMMRLIA
jgi:hypothetical protein